MIPFMGLLRSQCFNTILIHPYFQRLKTYFPNGIVSELYPGAVTRSFIMLGCMHLMQRQQLYCVLKLPSLKKKTLYIAILLHDIGHGPFSHAMEKKY
jgi:HD superfamily phosphohydrolase